MQLSSDILEQQFGPTRLQIITQRHLERIICTLDASGQRLELSYVHFLPAIVEQYTEIYQQIETGKSVGKAFREAGVAFRRDDQSTQSLALTATLAKWFGQQGQATAVQTRIYVGDQRLHVADIFELYNPTVTWPTKTISAKPDNQLEYLDRVIQQYSTSA